MIRLSSFSRKNKEWGRRPNVQLAPQVSRHGSFCEKDRRRIRRAAESGDDSDDSLRTSKSLGPSFSRSFRFNRSGTYESTVSDRIQAAQAYMVFEAASAEEKRQTKVDLCPSVTPAMAQQVFAEVTRNCGFEADYRMDNGALIAHVVRRQKPLQNLRSDTRLEFPLVQEVVIRRYAAESATYSTVYLSWLATRLRPAGSGMPRLGQAFKSKKQRIAKELEQLVEEIVGRWRATLFQRGYALEAATLENDSNALWRSLAADEVDYEDSDDDDEATNLQDFSAVDGAETWGTRSWRRRTSSSSFSSSRSSSETDVFRDMHTLPPPPALGRAAGASKASPGALPSIVSPSQMSRRGSGLRRLQSAKMEDAGLSRSGSHRLARHGSTATLLRPKSALKLPWDAAGQHHGPKKVRSVMFSEEDKILVLKMTRDHREARMGAGCSATNEFGEVRPLTSTRTGGPVSVRDPASFDEKAVAAELDKLRRQQRRREQHEKRQRRLAKRQRQLRHQERRSREDLSCGENSAGETKKSVKKRGASPPETRGLACNGREEEENKLAQHAMTA